MEKRLSQEDQQSNATHMPAELVKLSTFHMAHVLMNVTVHVLSNLATHQRQLIFDLIAQAARGSAASVAGPASEADKQRVASLTQTLVEEALDRAATMVGLTAANDEGDRTKVN